MSATATAFSLCSHERSREWNRSKQIVLKVLILMHVAK